MPSNEPILQGDAFLVNFPRFDQARQQLMQEQMQRRMYQQKEATQIDGQLAKQISRIRSVDTPEVFDSYNQYKNLKKQLLFDPKVRNNPQAYNQVQQQANEALATTFQKADQSARYNQMGRDLFTSYRGHPDRYAVDFGDRMNAFQSTPMSKLEDHDIGDLSNPDTYMYKGDNVDAGALDKAARGQIKERASIEEPIDAQGLQTKITPYNYGNSPAEYYHTMLGSLVERKVGKGGVIQSPSRYASASWEHLLATNPSLIEHVNQEYDKITPDQWKKMTGSETPQVISPDPSNNADQFAAYQAKLYALNNAPQPGKVSTRNNQAPILAEKNQEREKLQANSFKQQKIMQSIRNNQAIGRINLHHLYAQQDAAGQNALVDAHFNDEFDEAKKQQPLSIPTDSGKPLVGFKYNPINTIAKEFVVKDEKGHPMEPNGGYIISPDGKTVTGVFLKMGADGKTATVDDSKTVQKSVDNELKPVYKAFAAPKSKVPASNIVPPKPKIPVTLHKGIFDDLK